MATDDAPGWGVTRSVTAVGVDALDAVAVLVAHVAVFVLSVPLWLGLDAVAGVALPAVGGAPAWLTPPLIATALWLTLLGPGLALAAARALSAPPETMLTRRPGVLLVAPAVLLVGAVAALAQTGENTLVLALLLAEYVLVRRTVHLFAGHVRTGRLPRWGRTLVATAALAPLSLATVFLEAALLARFLPMDWTGSAWLLGRLTAAGLPARVSLGAALFQTQVFVLLALPPLVCGAYVAVQWVRGLSRRADGGVGRSTDDFARPATGWFAVPDSGSAIGPLWDALEPVVAGDWSVTADASDASAGAPSASTSSADAASADAADPLADSRTDRKYDDPESERAHREAQQRDPAEVVDLGEQITLVLEEVDYDRDPPKVMGTKHSLVVFVEDAPPELERLDTVCVKVTDYGGKGNSAEAVFLAPGPCEGTD